MVSTILILFVMMIGTNVMWAVEFKRMNEDWYKTCNAINDQWHAISTDILEHVEEYSRYLKEEQTQ